MLKAPQTLLRPECGPFLSASLLLALLGSVLLGSVLLGSVLLGSAPHAIAANSDAPCRSGNQPAATLLIPYFEVDLEDPEGITTLFSVANASLDPVIAHAVLWTDWGIPTLAWDIYLGGEEVRTYNLRDLFANGTLPQSGGAEPFGSCAFPIGLAPLAAVELTALTQQHTGQEVEPSESCFSAPREDDSLANGYVTIDVVRDCAGAAQFPTDPGYFGADGLVGYDNVLWGDFFYVTSGEDFAQGEAAVAVRADLENLEGGDYTFYSRFIPDTISDHRIPLSSTYRSRFLEGGPFDGGTELILWIDSGMPANPIDCSIGNALSTCRFLQLTTYDERGEEQEEPIVLDPGQLHSQRLKVGSDELPATTPFGFLDIANRELLACHLIPIGVAHWQAWVAPVISARGRFSVGLGATPLDDPCAADP